MSRHLLKGRILAGRFRGAKRIRKHNILLIIILAIAVRLFFSISSERIVFAEKPLIQGKNRFLFDDPLERIGKDTFKKNSISEKICLNSLGSRRDKGKAELREAIFENLVKAHPIVVMIPWIAEQDKEVAAYLIGIAKKESDWGKHAPQKNGRDCFNYWGYRGGYKATDSGYSCFDDPKQAVEVVGGRIKSLIFKKIKTPAQMVVWKCGQNCAGHKPADVKKWISDVSLYYDKLNS
jgi:hypothetical protein